MATMNRNVNLEEINSDAFMGIPYLNHQSILQKVIFVGSIVLAVGINLAANFMFHISMNIAVLLTLLPLIVGIAFGCNYNEDLSLIKYIRLIIFKPTKTYYSRPTEDLEQLRNSAARIRKEEELNQRQQAGAEEQKKLLIKVLLGLAVAMVALILVLMIIKGSKTEEIHHMVAYHLNKIWECCT